MIDKRIEEMARDMDYGCIKRDLYPDDAKEIAKALYLLGYRKIPENAIVLMDDDEIKQYKWGKMLNRMGFFEFTDKLKKETAKEILMSIQKKITHLRVNGHLGHEQDIKLSRFLVSKAQDYGVGVK